MNVSEIMSNNVHLVSLDENVADAAKLMRETGTGCLVVLDGDTVTGILTERDMVLGCLIDGHISWNCHVYRHMTILDETAHPYTDIGEAAMIMMENEITYLPVIDEGKVAGILNAEDISRSIEGDNAPRNYFSSEEALIA